MDFVKTFTKIVRLTLLRHPGTFPLMRTTTGLLALAALATSGCALLGFGPPTGVVEGWVQQSPSFTPAAYAEVCVYGMDTLCIRANREGHYRIKLTEQTVWLRFRFGGQHPHRSEPFPIVLGGRLEVSCAIADRLVVTPDPIPCLPIRQD